MHRSNWHYKPHRREDRPVRQRIKEIAATRVRYGMWRIYILLRREGFKDNHKRVHRIYKEEGLNLRNKRPRRSKAAAHRLQRPEINSLQVIRPLLKPKADELFPGSMRNIILQLVDELQGINPVITNVLHIRGSVIINWLKQYNKRQVQYMAGHKYISSTEVYAVQELETLQDELGKHHPFG
jgi:transposase